MIAPNAFEESYRDVIYQEMNTLKNFPLVFSEALKQSSRLSTSDDRVSVNQFQSSIEECLAAMVSLSRLSRDLHMLSS